MHRVLRAPIAGVAVVLLASLTACGSVAQQAAEQAVEQAVEQAAEQAGGVEVDVETDGDGQVTITGEDGSVQVGSQVSLPADFPSDIPTPEATLVSVVTANGGWTLSFEGVDRSSIDRLLEHYTGAGYQEEFAAQQAESVQASYRGDEWTVMLLWDGSGETKALVYSVAPGAGQAAQ